MPVYVPEDVIVDVPENAASVTAGPISVVAKFGKTAPPPLAARPLVILIALSVPVVSDVSISRYGWVRESVAPVLTIVAVTPIPALLIAAARPLSVLFVPSIVRVADLLPDWI